MKRITGLREGYDRFPIPDILGCAAEVDHAVESDRNVPEDVLVDMKVDEIAGAKDGVRRRFTDFI